MFSRCVLHTSAPLTFFYVLGAVRIWFVLLTNQEMLYWQANQNIYQHSTLNADWSVSKDYRESVTSDLNLVRTMT